jgi:hypothetical protein
VRRFAVCLAAATALAILPAGAARASVYTDVLHVYQVNGAIPPCQFSSAQLSAALRGIDTYGQQYFADFSNAVQAALAARASGVCTPGALSAAIAARRGSAGAPPGALPAAATSPTDANLPAPIVLMAAVAIAVAAALGLRALALSRGWDPEWAVRWRHAWGEASYRVGGGWAEVVDWLRGRR